MPAASPTEAGVANLRPDLVDFAAAAGLDLPPFDYIVAHGVYSWVDPAAKPRCAGLSIAISNPAASSMSATMRCRDGGATCRFSACCATSDDPARRRCRGVCRRRRNCPRARRCRGAGAAAERDPGRPRGPAARLCPGLSGPRIHACRLAAALRDRDAAPDGGDRPLPGRVGDPDREFRCARLRRCRARILREVADPDARELVRDFLLDQRLRCDVFDRGNRRLGPEERERRLLAGSYALARPAATIRGPLKTLAGGCDYDTATARAIVGALVAGRRPADELVPAPDVLENLLSLCAAGAAMPVEPSHVPVAALNRAIARRLGGPEEIGWLALPCGTAIAADRGHSGRLRDGRQIDDEGYPGWRGFLASLGLQPLP